MEMNRTQMTKAMNRHGRRKPSGVKKVIILHQTEMRLKLEVISLIRIFCLVSHQKHHCVTVFPFQAWFGPEQFFTSIMRSHGLFI